MIFSLEVLRARKGDCLLLHYGTQEKKALMVIDGGPKGVYGPHLRPRLAEIQQARQGGNKPQPIELVMVSHVDDDHIQGILEMTKELRDKVGQPLVRIRRVWHNSFDEIIGNDLEAEFGAAQFGAASVQAAFDAAGGEDDEAFDAIKVLASIPQGHQLRLDSEALNLPLNPQHDGKLVIASKKAIKIPNGPSFLVAGPLRKEIEALRKKHDQWLKELKKKGLKPGDVLAAYADQSVTNLSSLVILATAGGKSILLTGDARGDRVLAGLEEAGAIKKGGSLHVDVLKVPHHGSIRNVEQDFFERITADHYVFSGDGEHGNPERDTFELLAAARPDADYTIHLTYPVDEIDEGRKHEWQKTQAKAAKKGKKLPNWSKKRDSLAAYFDENPPPSLAIVEEGTPHLIDLGEEVADA